MNRLLHPFLVLIAFPTLASAEPELSGAPQELESFLAGRTQTVSLSGEAKVQVPVERAIATLRVVSEGRTLADTIRENRELRSKVATQLQKAGIPAEAISGSRFSSSPNYGLFGEKAKSYRIENLVQVTVTDDQQFQALASAVDRLPEVHFQGIEPQPGDVEQHKLVAMRNAIENAEKRREIIESTLGITLKTRSVQTADVGFPRPMPMLRGSSYAGSAVKTMASSAAGAESAATGGTAEAGGLGEITVTANVTVIYAATGK
jgi:uncharacterized protein YggE